MTAIQPRLVGEGADGLQHRLAELLASLGLDALGFIQQAQLLQQGGGRGHGVGSLCCLRLAFD